MICENFLYISLRKKDDVCQTFPTF